MATEQVFLAVDLGASSGRVVAGLLDGRRLALEEVYRFDNGGVAAAGRLYWPLLTQWQQVLTGLRAAGARYGGRVVSVGVDTWGVDFALLGRHDELLGYPLHYRDRRTAGIFEQAFARVPREAIFEATGLQFMEFNTLYQLLAMKLADSPLLDVAQSLLMMPDLFHWLLTGVKTNEYTNATTTQCFDPRRQVWAAELLARMDLPVHIFGPVAAPGTRLGGLRSEVAAETHLDGAEVILPGTHDTASAVAAVPAASRPGQRPDWCYISSGTWSLMGVELPQPVVTRRCYELNFTNEGGVGGTTRLLKNIPGLWLVQECRRIWKQAGREYGWEELVRRASETPPLLSLIDPDDPSFVAPADMPQAIAAYCQRTGQVVPASEGAIIRTALESIALRYRMVLGYLEELAGGRLETIHIVGGGTQNRLLCQMTADACNRRVVAGPVEATAVGNLTLQAVARGALGSIAEAREVIGTSFAVEKYLPRLPQPWDDAYGRFVQLAQRRLP